MVSPVSDERWNAAQKAELEFWRFEGQGVNNSFHEEKKQLICAKAMGIIVDEWSRIDLNKKSILDIGGGPASLLLKCWNGGKKKVIDPLNIPEWVKIRYNEAGIELLQIPAEEMNESGWDEVWMYNVLQHVKDPAEIIRRARSAGKVVRIFEFLNREPNEAHPHNFTQEILDKAFENKGTVSQLADPIVGDVYVGVFEQNKKIITPMEIHWVNTGKAFPYAYYVAIESALRTQKASKFNLWLVEKPSGKYFDLIKDKVTIRKLGELKTPHFKALEGQEENFINAHTVDYWRWYILYNEGGIFCDLDSLSLEDYVMTISERLSTGKQFLASLCVSERIAKPYHNSIFAAVKGSDIIRKMLDLSVERLSMEEGFKWGNSGPDVLNDVCAENLDLVAEAEYGLLGGCLEMYQLFKEDGKLPDNIRFIHLWANSINGYWKEINTEGFINTSNYLYAKLVRRILNISSFIDQRGNHYRRMFQHLKDAKSRGHEIKNILEIGTYNGENALQMIKTIEQSGVDEKSIHYYGVDLFEEIDADTIASEFSHPSTPSIADVQKYLSDASLAQIGLAKGNTRKIMKEIAKDLPQMDLIYIDGGHSIETIRSDWKNVQKLINDKTVIYFDDYLSEMPFIGCKFIVDELDNAKYVYAVLPEADDYPKPFGKMHSQLLMVQMRTNSYNVISVSNKPALHILGLAHTQTNKEYCACAYTQKVLKMCKMMTDLGYTVYHYGTEGSEVQATEDVQVLTRKTQLECYGDYDWKKEMFKHDPKDLAYTTFNKNAIIEINKRKGPHDILMISMGNYQKPIFDQVGLTGIESGIGYTGVFTDRRVFESYAWMHYIYGMMYPNNGGCDGSNYDCVIPNYYDKNDFEFCDQKEDYYLYMGRLIGRKGVHIAYQACLEIGKKLIIAGQGTDEVLKTLGIDPKKVEFAGYADTKMRSQLMSRAKAIFVPTIYLEPFGGVNVEAMFCGTPAITSDWGGFTETVQHGKTGYRCRTMDDFTWAAQNVDKLDAKYIRDYAVNNYSTERIGLMYDEYIKKVDDLFRAGWYEKHPDRTQLDWLARWH